MSRHLPEDAPNAVFHVTARVNWRVFHLAPRFCADLFYRLAGECWERFGIDLLAFVLMSNHYHLIVRSPDEPRYRDLTTRRTRCRHTKAWPRGHQKSTVLAQFMKRLMHCTSCSIQRELGISGRFWEDPYHARRIVDDVDLVATIAYDHLNPVRAKMVARPEEYPRSSAAWWSGLDGSSAMTLLRRPPPFALGLTELRERVSEWQANKCFAEAMAEFAEAGMSLGSEEGQKALRKLLRYRGLIGTADAASAPGDHNP